MAAWSPVIVTWRFDTQMGAANVFAFTEPLTGWRHLVVTDQRTKTDWAEANGNITDKLLEFDPPKQK